MPGISKISVIPALKYPNNLATLLTYLLPIPLLYGLNFESFFSNLRVLSRRNWWHHHAPCEILCKIIHLRFHHPIETRNIWDVISTDCIFKNILWMLRKHFVRPSMLLYMSCQKLFKHIFPYCQKFQKNHFEEGRYEIFLQIILYVLNIFLGFFLMYC